MQTENLTRIGLNEKRSEKLAEMLNDLLANYSIFYQNVRGYHWNIQGDKFFELHIKFEELYNNLFLKIDDVAERILTLSFKPNYKFTEYLKTSSILESNKVTDGQNSIEEILKSLQTILTKQRLILDLSAGINDVATNALMNDYISEQEKLVWMYSVYLKV